MAFFSRNKGKTAVKPVSVEVGGGVAVAVPDTSPSEPPAILNDRVVDDGLEKEIQSIGSDFLTKARSKKAGLLSSQFWSDKLMDWAMQDHEFKVQLFRFVDCYPMLHTPEEVHDHLIDYMTQPGVTMPPGLDLGLKAGSIAKGMFTKTMTKQITGMAQKFIAGTDAASAVPRLRQLWDSGMAFSVDLLGEACVSRKEALDYQRKYLDLIDNLPRQVKAWKANERLETDYLGPVPRVNVSIKISSLFSMTDPINTEGSVKALVERLGPILESASKNNVFINFDIEQFAMKDLTIELFQQCCEKFDFHAGLALQAYLRSGPDDAKRVIDWAKACGRQVTVRLVKGAYWDYETIHAEEQGWPVPVWSRKCDTDACFEKMAGMFIENMPRSAGEGGVKLALGSHNVRSIAFALAMLRRNGFADNAIELQMLHGMGDQLKHAAAEIGLRLREYVPVGEMLPGMAYLVRRLLENTSNESWLKAGFSDNVPEDVLLANPLAVERHGEDPGVAALKYAPERHQLSPAIEGVGDSRSFYTEPLRDFSQSHVRESFARHIASAVVPEVKADRTEEDAERALAAAHDALPRWRSTPIRERSQVLVRAASIMRRRRDELAGVMIREAGKTWREADGDVCEAVDFLEYYARVAVPLFDHQRLGRFIGELDQIVYQPRGVALVISPWNFPLAILTGMSSAALVTGNPVLIKPAGPTLGIAKIYHEIMLEAGAPPNCFHFMAGPGRTVGAKMVRDHRVALIAFTGSMEVGLDICAAAGQVPGNQFHVKKVICEMGGKNALIVDASADLDEAVLAVRQSAFGYQGQKCSACSRVIVLESNYDLFLERLCEATRALKVGNPLDPSVDFGPIIDESAWRTINEYIEKGKQESRLALAMDVPDESKLAPGRKYIAPHIFAEVPPNATIAREEIFGPVLSVIKVKTFEEGLKVANASSFKLTGGIFSRKPEHIEMARAEFRVGNLYINRNITGAAVGRQPFGGFGMSGVGTKAGGPDYLLHFVEPRTICENTMRRGFAPEL